MDRRLEGHEDLPWVILPGLKSLSIDQLMCWLPVVVRLVTVRYPRPDRRAQPKYKRKVFWYLIQQYSKCSRHHSHEKQMHKRQDISQNV
jgi:hypothetical protein